jgi:hypothetical protein
MLVPSPPVAGPRARAALLMETRAAAQIMLNIFFIIVVLLCFELLL